MNERAELLHFANECLWDGSNVKLKNRRFYFHFIPLRTIESRLRQIRRHWRAARGVFRYVRNISQLHIFLCFIKDKKSSSLRAFETRPALTRCCGYFSRYSPSVSKRRFLFLCFLHFGAGFSVDVVTTTTAVVVGQPLACQAVRRLTEDYFQLVALRR